MAKRKKVPGYRLHKPSGKAVVTLNYKDHYLGVYNTPESKIAYKRLIREYKQAGSAFGVQPGKITIAMLMDEYLAHCEQHYPDTRGSETPQIEYALDFIEDYQDTCVNDFGPLKLKAVREQMVGTVGPNSGRPYSRNYVNKMVDRIRRMFRFGVENELCEAAILTALKAIKPLQRGRTAAVETNPVKPVTTKQVELTLPNCTSIVGDMIRLQRLTGMRPGEVVRLTPNAIDRSGAVWIYRPIEHKTAWRGQERIIYIGPQGQAILAKYLNREPTAALFSPAESEAERRSKLSAARVTPASCGNKPGSNKSKKPKTPPSEAYTAPAYGKSVMYACKQTWPYTEGMKPADKAAHRQKYWWSPNQLRHAAATSIRAAHGLEAAQVLLGHNQASTTEVYAETDHSRAIAIALSVG